MVEELVVIEELAVIEELVLIEELAVINVAGTRSSILIFRQECWKGDVGLEYRYRKTRLALIEFLYRIFVLISSSFEGILVVCRGTSVVCVRGLLQRTSAQCLIRERRFTAHHTSQEAEPIPKTRPMPCPSSCRTNLDLYHRPSTHIGKLSPA